MENYQYEVNALDVEIITYRLIIWERLLVVAWICGGGLRGGLANGTDNIPDNIDPAARTPSDDQQQEPVKI